MIIVWAKPARTSFLAHMDYLLDRSPSGAANVSAAVMAQIKLLEQSPYMGRPGRVENTRELVISKYPYIVCYRVVVDIIEILYVHHSRQDWPLGEED